MIPRRTVLAALAGAACLRSARARQAPEKKDVHIGVGGKASLYYLPRPPTPRAPSAAVG